MSSNRQFLYVKIFFKLAGAEFTTASPELRVQLEAAVKDAFQVQIYINSLLALLGAVVAWLLIEGKKQKIPPAPGTVITNEI
jgi:hypothetical protein